jgi:hypothetical protein
MEGFAISKQNYMTLLKSEAKNQEALLHFTTYSAQEATTKIANMNWSIAQEK